MLVSQQHKAGSTTAKFGSNRAQHHNKKHASHDYGIISEFDKTDSEILYIPCGATMTVRTVRKLGFCGVHAACMNMQS